MFTQKLPKHVVPPTPLEAPAVSQSVNTGSHDKNLFTAEINMFTAWYKHCFISVTIVFFHNRSTGAEPLFSLLWLNWRPTVCIIIYIFFFFIFFFKLYYYYYYYYIGLFDWHVFYWLKGASCLLDFTSSNWSHWTLPLDHVCAVDVFCIIFNTIIWPIIWLLYCNCAKRSSKNSELQFWWVSLC